MQNKRKQGSTASYGKEHIQMQRRGKEMRMSKNDMSSNFSELQFSVCKIGFGMGPIPIRLLWRLTELMYTSTQQALNNGSYVFVYVCTEYVCEDS